MLRIKLENGLRFLDWDSYGDPIIYIYLGRGPGEKAPSREPLLYIGTEIAATTISGMRQVADSLERMDYVLKMAILFCERCLAILGEEGFAAPPSEVTAAVREVRRKMNL